ALRIAAALVPAVFLLIAFNVASGERTTGLRVTATTTMMQAAVRDIAGDRVQVTVLIPGGSCPGHYDIRPGDVQALKRSAVLFTHGYEGFVPRLRAAAGLSEAQVVGIPVPGNWQLPDVYVKAAQSVTAALSKADAAGRPEYLRRFKTVQARARAVDIRVRNQARKAGFGRTAVICSDQQADVLRWMGFRVTAVYGRPEEFTPSGIHRLVKMGKADKVGLVVDNLQSGADAGKQLARQLGARHVILSNFPGGFSNTGTWESTVLENTSRVVKALGGHSHGK
ncbi:MAG: metal ABC transporter substrate-binding protein, partial [bacterium]|nr:metal ABC transporter substrate-binding protein [bacterium]